MLRNVTGLSRTMLIHLLFFRREAKRGGCLVCNMVWHCSRCCILLLTIKKTNIHNNIIWKEWNSPCNCMKWRERKERQIISYELFLYAQKSTHFTQVDVNRWSSEREKCLFKNVYEEDWRGYMDEMDTRRNRWMSFEMGCFSKEWH